MQSTLHAASVRPPVRRTKLQDQPRYCGARSNRTGQPCRRSPINGTSLCKAHRGGTAHMRRSSAIKLQMKAVKDALAQLGRPLGAEESPQEVLLSAVASAHRQRYFLEQLAQTIDQEALARIGEVPFPGQKIVPGARAEVIMRLLSDATKNAGRTSKLALDAGLEERLVNLAEKQAMLMVQVLQAAIAKLDLPPKEKTKLLASAANELRQLAAGPAIEGEFKEVKSV